MRRPTKVQVGYFVAGFVVGLFWYEVTAWVQSAI